MKLNDRTRPSEKREARQLPDWIIKASRPSDRKGRLERIGAAWSRDDGGICLRFHGTQIIGSDIYLFPAEDKTVG